MLAITATIFVTSIAAGFILQVATADRWTTEGEDIWLGILAIIALVSGFATLIGLIWRFLA